MAKHAFYAPSASHRWLTCTASAAIDTSGIPDRPSPAAEMGTAMHLCAEQILRGKVKRTVVKGKTFNGVKMTPEMIDEIVIPYVEFVEKYTEPTSEVFIEHKAVIQSDCWGTCDAVIVTPDKDDSTKVHITVIDLKTGAGQKISPIGNTQLNIYAAGILRDMELLGDVASIKVGIVQPPFNTFALVPVTVEELYEFENLVLTTIEDIEAGRVTYAPSEENCKYCRAASICPKLQEIANEAAVEDFKGIKRMAARTLSEKAEMVPMLKTYIAVIEEELERRLLSGKKVKGWRLGKGNKKRKFRYGDAALDKRLDKMKIPKTWRFTSKRATVSELERVLKENGKDPAILSSLITTEEGGPIVVPESSSRADYDQSEAAAADFSSASPRPRKG